MDFMKKLGVAPMKAIKGDTGLYFKFADGLDNNAGPIELYFKPKFISALADGKDGITKMTWLEVNILWVGEPSFQDFDGTGWAIHRTGKYRTKEGEKFAGYLLGKRYTPMGEFNDNLMHMHKWLAENCQVIQDHLDVTLLPLVSGSTYMPVQVIFDYMLEQLSKDTIELKGVVHTEMEFTKSQGKYKAALNAKYEEMEKNASESSGDDNEDDEQ